MLKETARALLYTATGGLGYQEELWGHAMLLAVDCSNRNNWKTKVSPWEQLTGSPYVWGEDQHVFGEYVLYGVPKQNRAALCGPWRRRLLPAQRA